MHSHHASAGRFARVQVVTVSTSRTEATDASGPLLCALLEGAGHAVAGRGLVPDDPAAIGAALDAALAAPDVDAVVLTGGTGVSARDGTPAVVRPRLDRELPGFGELFRMLSFQEVGAAAMLSTALGGIARGKPVFALPGSVKACRLAMEKLILPELGHLLAELGKETPLPAAVPAPASEPAPREAVARVSVRAPVAEPPAEAEATSGWKAALAALGGTVQRGAPGEIPEALERCAPAMDVLRAAGERTRVQLADGRSYVAFGYPDLARGGAKVLLVGPGEPIAEVVALHRWPARVGLCVEGSDGLCASAELPPERAAEERGVRYAGDGRLFAVEGGAIHVQEGRQVVRADARGASAAVPVASALGSLLLHWSQR